MPRFAGFELDPQRAELRGPDGQAIHLRPKAFDMLALFAAHPGRVLSKQELMAAVWPNVHVGDDNLFQCIKEIRTALGDDKRQLIKVSFGRGYLFDAQVSLASAATPPPSAPPVLEAGAVAAPARTEPAKAKRWRWIALAALVVAALAIGAAAVRPGAIFPPRPATIAVMPITDPGSDPLTTEMAANVTSRLVDGLAGIANLRVLMPSSAAADFVVSAELEKGDQAWNLHGRMTDAATGEVRWTAALSVDLNKADPQLQQSRLTAAVGHALALRVNALQNPARRSADGAPAGSVKVAIEQATASINQTTPERFRAAQTILESALANDPGNAELEVALAAFQLRGIQLAWYDPAERDAAENNATTILERALRARPHDLAVHESYCRLLTATNRFVESLVACARALTYDPWNGLVLYQLGLAQLQLGRFEDALASFRQADRLDTPQVSRWTWLLGAGWSYLLMGRAEEALPWLQRALAITAGSGRAYLLLAAAYQQLGRFDEARAAVQKTLELRPGSNAGNVKLPAKNASPAFLEGGERIAQSYIAAGLPER